jgi:hypothetical protein
LNVTNLPDKGLAWADYVFISAMIVQPDAAAKAASDEPDQTL